ncbi:TonB-dependent receptor [Photorhabdus temperata]|uniref:Outer membrane receptor protein n=2 Tax=Photorhabdus khanii TaxID=1004150 RepID=W3V3J5_9GAMM|nr:TonB-dependent receptor [Photorhabdus khanii]ETS30412.1 outer membrane receptor protein [Photorhabdus khanii NC19]MQL46889.1 TonB-dependent receptor [Photorhabdus khanii]OHV59177.1 TonB-dependent receptor [Photorhabdus temperata]
MKIMTKIAGASVVFIGLQGLAYGEEKQEGKSDKVLKFSSLKVSGSQDNAEVRAMEKPGSYSSKGEDTKLQSIDSLLRSMPGTYTQIDPGQGTVSVNIRGLSGFGRVNMMVDGVSQSFYGSAPTSVIHGNSNNNQFGTLIDPNFIVGMDISRGQSDGSDSVNALAGSANFRTIGIDDVIFSGNTLGTRTKMTYGDNGIGRSGMIAIAGKTQAFSSEGSIGAMLAASGHSIDANYKNGDGILSDEFATDESFKQKPNSQLMKLNIKPNDFHDMELSSRFYHNKFTRRHIDNEDIYFKYNYKPFSEWVDMKLLVSSSESNQNYESNALLILSNSKTKNKSNAVNISNTSRFNYGDIDFELIFGSKLMKTEYSKTTDTKYTGNKGNNEEEAKANEKIDHDAKENNVFAPKGKQDIASIYSGLKISRGIYQANINLNYMDYNVKGHKPACELRVNCFPQGETELNLKENGFNPGILLSAEIIPEFEPFVSYTRSMRAPNVQEVFYGNEGGASINPFLKGEKSDTYQIGFNSFRPDLLVKGDIFRLKAVWYHTKIKNYINNESYTLCKNGRKCKYSTLTKEDWKYVDVNFNMYIYSNSITPVIMRGYEVSADYDAGIFYSKLSYSQQKTHQPTSISTAIFGADPVSELPKNFMTLDTGIRLLDEKLSIGAIVKYTGDSYKMDRDPYNQDADGRTLMQKEQKIPTVFDLYSDYRINKNVLLKFSVQNLTNRNYSEALNRLSSAPVIDELTLVDQTARGRTYIAGAEIRF